MENTDTEQETESSSRGVFKLLGEPAIVINGVPHMPPNNSTPVLSNTVNNAELNGNTVFGDWLEGRTVQKLFGEQYYSGMVTEFDKESGWYRVVYEDGDFEDLDWNELEEVLLPLDITVPLRSLALKTIRRSKKVVNKSGKGVGHSRISKAKNVASKGKKISEHEEAKVDKPQLFVEGKQE
ncbi:hypothetical protein I3843_10G130900 [Carya illinoinensis]|uniref:PTM/DIR17-like Tudor domain-containing protein n=1 Tax=Carya illinoinensis TaxID=32201 RepID=A0A8T1PCV8_CARIL|nr:dirigent protein 17-like [Carya illinoinensis]XP_042945353.1 dirigent protein 17-like [Carya illinoinensis]XP_042945354.1 dirigent protein 17-like [Carya illinoinensis]XP_042945355.1 dirigent protein 17-like [Carya illinoinensis]KAG2685688.1 hypothetical protein I3760_10G137500 [Carya illinoinensis]KAG2685689.1 hypothetical protein I3760_10G137500 [Carya illinoinensis]KAG6639978.1 hypothetical protein CIPAW_10G139200 [Carya illinoinensis]KAG6692864.1 hypothetical protein I3842_10G135800 [